MTEISYTTNVTAASQLTTNETFVNEAIDQFLTHQTGILTNPGSSFLAFEKLPQKYSSTLSNSTKAALAEFPDDWPDVEYIAQSASFALPSNSSDTNNYVSILFALLTATSRGNVTINTTDTSVNPLVSPNWLSTSADIEVAIAAFKRTRDITSQAPKGFLLEEVVPGPQIQSDEQILTYLKSTLVTVHHSSRTCMMGKAGDPNAVVDSKGRVFGVHGLRVVDASVFNLLPPGHCQATVYCLAEKIAAEIQAGL
jgi:choline dehydrogenase